MNNKQIFEEIYHDFFEKEIKVDEVATTNNSINELLDKVDVLNITNDSKDLLTKIIKYMDNYKEKDKLNYLNFSMIINSEDLKTSNEIINVLEKANKKCNYLQKTSLNEVSFLHTDKNTDLNEIYTNNGIIVFNNLNGFELLSDIDRKRISSDILKYLKTSNTLTIINGTKEETKNFMLANPQLKNYLSFIIDYQKPDVQDVYQLILEKVNIKEEDQIKLLDYITNTINNVTDYESYQNNLIKDLTFFEKVPELEKKKSLDEIFKDLNELVGLKKVKKVLYELADLLELKDKSKDLKISNVNLHMVFLGNPGTGKTTVARIVADILYNLKYIKTNNLIEVSSKDLVAEYVGQTAPKTNSVIEKALDGVLFVDEAYSLAVKNNDNSYNAEAIATLIQAMENYRDRLVVIFAGYTKEMQDFLNSNSGITSRIGYTLEFDDYTTEELIQIFTNMATKNGFNITDDAIDYLKEIIDYNRTKDNFGNARFVRNVYEKSIIKHAANTKNKKQKRILSTITKDDISIENLI